MATQKDRSENLLTSKQKWTVHDAGVNLAALLNDPRKVKRDYDLFTKTWGETFRDLPQGIPIRRSKWVPDVQEGHFRDYLENTRDRVMRHESKSLKSLEEQGNAEDSLKSPTLERRGTVFRNNKGKLAIKAAIVAEKKREAVIKTRAALDAIPKIFLRQDFTMENPHVFSNVLISSCDTSCMNQEEKRSSDFSHKVSQSRLLQEKLSHYLDMVEMAIVRQISLQSDSFFRAMDFHDTLHTDLNGTLESIKKLLNQSKIVRTNVVASSLQVVKLHRLDSNASALIEKLRMMVTVHQTQPTIQLLLSSSEYAGALDLIHTTQEVLHQELAGLNCFRHLSSQLSEMERVIGHMMRQDIDQCLRDEITRPLTQDHMIVNGHENVSRESVHEPHRLTAITLGLLRQGRFDFLDGFRDEIEMAVKSAIKDAVSEACHKLTESESSAERNEELTLAGRMRMLSFTDWISLLDLIFARLLVLLNRVRSILGLVGELTSKQHQITVISSKPSRTNRRPARRKTTRTSSSKIPRDVAHSRNNNNPFLDDYETENGETSNSFLTSHIVSSRSTNPFEDEDDDVGDRERHLMDGLASYEDELISSAADAFDDSPHDISPLRKSDDNLPPPLPEDSSGSSSEQYDNDDDEGFGMVNGDPTISSDAMASVDRSMRDLMHSSCDFVQDRCVKVLMARGREGALDRLTSDEFLQLAKSIKYFTCELESLSQRSACHRTELSLSLSDRPVDESNSFAEGQYAMTMGAGGSLRGALMNQASKFVARFHEERRTKLSLILDNELWKQAEVPAELYRLLQSLVDGKITSSANNSDNADVSNGAPKEGLNNGFDMNNTNSSSEYLELNGERYAVVGTVLIMLKMVTEYCTCSNDLPASSSDLIHRLRDLLTLFNSRTCQLVLGAGALQLVGLKTITTKNLALASRCLQLVLRCIPSIRSHFEDRMQRQNHNWPHHNHVSDSANDKSSQKNLAVLRHFDHVVRDYENHVCEIENKLHAIVASVFDKSLPKYEVKAPVPSATFRAICKQLCKFHDTVNCLLPQEQTQSIFLKLNDDFKQRMSRLLVKQGVCRDGGPQHGLVTSDLNFYEKSLLGLGGMNEVNLELYTVWT